MQLYELDAAEREAREWREEAKAAELITTSFIPVNMWLVRMIGLDATLFLSSAYEELLFLRKKKKVKSRDTIEMSVKKMQLKTGLCSFLLFGFFYYK